MTQTRRLLNALTLSILTLMLTSCNLSAASQANNTTRQQGSSMENIEPKHRFEALLQSRDSEFIAARIKLFSSPADVAYLKQRFTDPDRVVGFIARELYAWATEIPKEYAGLETFFNVTEPALQKTDRTAKGGGGSAALFDYLTPYLNNQKEVAQRLMNHLLLRSLMQPQYSPYIYSVLLQYYSTYPVPEPEVWIRVSLQKANPKIVENIVESSLPLVHRERLIQALNHERVHALRNKLAWPQQFDDLRKNSS
jgi:hypothetical protein